ncbi:MAG TPA: DUF4836 family protein, partial [Bacteroidetes bacterium]|nr:DUF4836 family protein [Bacteroidota bacterium]
MKPLQTMLFFAFFLCVNMTITAQKLLEYISKDAAIVAGINPSALKEKANFEAIRKMEFYQAILDQIPKGKDSETGKIFSDIFKTPEKYGMDFYSPSYFFVEKGKDGFFINYIFKLSDANTFNAFFQEQIAKDGKSEIQNLAHYQLINNNGVAFAWNEKIVLISAGENKSKFQGADISTFKTDVNEVLKSLVERAMKLDKQHSILQNPQFLKAQAMPNDAFIWMDYGYMIEIGKM